MFGMQMACQEKYKLDEECIPWPRVAGWLVGRQVQVERDHREESGGCEGGLAMG